MVKKFSWHILSFVLILILAGILRFYRLGDVPIELNRDEASIGYTAFSILKTGHEEHGVFWPINIESFGDWKLPVYIYTLIPFIKIFGLQPWVVKLPSALAGLGIVILGWILTWQLSKDLIESRWRVIFSHLVMLMLAISPWAIHLSHMAYEAHLAMFLVIAGTALFIWAIENKKQLNKWGIALSAIFFGLTLFTYHSYQLFTPLFVIALLSLYRPQVIKLWSNAKPVFWLSASIGAFFSIALVLTSIKANQTKFAALSIFDKRAYAPVIEVNRGYFTNRNHLLAKIRDNYPGMLANQIQRNVTDLFSTKFFFFEGGTHGSHDIPGTGKMYPVELIFLIIAGYVILTQFQTKTVSRSTKLILSWIVIGAIAPIITFEAAHTIRFSPALFALIFLSTFGLLTILKQFKKPRIFVTLLIMTGILIYSVIYFLTTYFVIAPKRDINKQNWEMKTLIQLINERGSTYNKILMPGTTWSPYIYFLFYNQIDPTTLNQQIEYFPVGSDGFRHVKKLGKIDFSDVNWNETDNANTLYVIKRPEISLDKLESKHYQIEYSLTNEWAKDEWLLFSHE